MEDITIVKTGVANTASVMAALKRAGTNPLLTSDVDTIASAKRLVIPGVGSFGAAMQTLAEQGVVDVLRERYQQGRPTLSICVGLQILANSSEESPGATGLGVLDTEVKRFKGDVRVPQFGWNLIQPDASCRLLETGYAYFANSYYLEPMLGEWSIATSNHGVDFTAAVEKGPILACQFHLELSGKWGASLLNRWLELSKEY